MKSDSISSKSGTIGSVVIDSDGSVSGLTNLNVNGGITTSGNINATNGTFTGNVSGTAGTFTGNVSGTAGTFTSLDVSNGNIENVGNVELDSISASDGTSLSINSNWTAAGQTCADLGTVTTVDIEGGSLDSVSIGSTTPGSGSFTTLSTSEGTFNNSLKIPVVSGGTSVASASDEGKNKIE